MLEVPVDCEIGTVCVLQSYVDHDPGPGWSDYACGRLGYDGERGTDFRLTAPGAMERGVPVLAAAAGRVIDTRDGMPDVSVRDTGLQAVQGREAGNRVAVLHDGNWITQYSHLRRGSVAVKPGDTVAAGQRLGLVGMSGRSEAPHLDFMVIHRDRVVDPFVGDVPFARCGDPRRPLWSPAALARLPYVATGPLDAGFTAEAPDHLRARRGDLLPPVSATTPRLAFWLLLFGLQAGDRGRLVVMAPDGSLLHDGGNGFDRPLAEAFLAADLPRPAKGWQPGTYRGVYTLIRGGKVLIEVRREATLAP